MNRRYFVHMGALGAAGLAIPISKLGSGDLILGSGDYRYKVVQSWVKASGSIKLKDCHEMVMDRRGRLILLTNEISNNLIYFNKDGKILKTAISKLPGAHGLTLKDLGGEERLYLTDTELGKVLITNIEGTIIDTWEKPDIDIYIDQPYSPTETAVADNGDVYVADGYGSQYIIHYNSKGEVVNVFGGRGSEERHLDNAHGIAIFNYRGEKHLLVTDRMVNKLKLYTMEGSFIKSFHYPGAYICRPVITDQIIYLATIWTGQGRPNSGMVTILDHEMKIAATLGGSVGYDEVMRQEMEVFVHPHDVCIDTDDNLYIPQWNAGRIFPTKLVRI